MANIEHEINYFATAVRQLIIKHGELRQELRDTKEKLAQKEKDLQETRLLLSAAKHDYDMLKTARMLEVGDGDIDGARKRVNKLIRDIDRCITLLSEQQSDSQTPKD